MKLVALLVASAIAVFAVDFRDFPNRPDHGLSTDQTLNIEPLNRGSEIFTEVDQPFVKERKGGKEKNIKGILKKELKSLKSMMGISSSSLNSKLEALKVNVNNLSSNINSRHQFLNSKLQSLTNNSNNMNFNLNSKIQSLTNDTNSKYQSLTGNMNNVNSNLNTKLQSLTDNMNKVNSNLNSKFQSLTNDTSIIKSNINSKLQPLNNISSELQSVNLNLESLSKNIGSIDNKTKTMGTELQSVKSNLGRLQNLPASIANIASSNSELTRDNLDIKSQLQLMINLMYNLNSLLNQDKTLQERCNGADLFWFNGQCFKYLKDVRRNWNDANTRCAGYGLQLAKPNDPSSILKHLVTSLGSTGHVFIGAKGSGSSFKWVRDGQTISNSDPNWRAGEPGSWLSSRYCLSLVANSGGVSRGKSYVSISCSYRCHTLCELV